MRRIMVVGTVALVMAAIMVAMAMPAFADKPGGFQLMCAHQGDPFAAIFVGPTAADVFAQAQATGYTRTECSLSARTNPI